MQNVRVGTCGICGGPVSTPAVWHGIILPEKKCEQCGAHPQNEFGPVLPMKEVRQENVVEIRTTDNTASTKSLCDNCLCDCVLEDFCDSDGFAVSKCQRYRTM